MMRIVAPLAALAVLTTASATWAQGAGKPSDLVGVPVSPEATDAPARRYPPPIVRLELAGIGLLITGGAWAASFATGQNWPTVPGASDLKIPIVGPWIALGKSGCATDETDCDGAGAKIGVRAALYMLDGIAQIAGLALIAEAIVMKTEPAKRKKSASSRFTLKLGEVEVTPVPMSTPTMTGVGFVGSF